MKKYDKPNNTFIHVLKKKVGAKKYSKGSKQSINKGYKSKKKLKKRNSAIKKMEPGKPKNTKQLIKLIKNSLGQKKFIPLTSVTNLVLYRLFIASTNKNELDDKSA